MGSMGSFFETLKSFRFVANDWKFTDFRLDIPPLSLGSDASNRHTQYSNPIAEVVQSNVVGFGYSFTLGNGNDFVVEAARLLVKELDGRAVGDILSEESGFYRTLTGNSQIRWLSPWGGVPMMSSGLIVNTIIDWASKSLGVPAWEFLAKLEPLELLSLIGLEHLSQETRSSLEAYLHESFESVDSRVEKLKTGVLPVYFTTWIGQSPSQVAEQIWSQFETRGITKFKLKIGSNFEGDVARILEIINESPPGVEFAADANQSLDFISATRWMEKLSTLGFLWLEEPFAPDNAVLFGDLSRFKDARNLTCQIASGENCPNPQTAASLLRSGIDIFQADTCRMLGLIDNVTTAALSRASGASYVPHAGGSGLDELARHTQLVNLSRVETTLDPAVSLTEHIGFTSAVFMNPAEVSGGSAKIPDTPGLGVGLAGKYSEMLAKHKGGVLWGKL